MKHSTGPWTFEPKKGCKVIRDANNQEVAFTPGLTLDDEDSANARLITAAPELLRWVTYLNKAVPLPAQHVKTIEDLLTRIHGGRHGE